MRLCVCVCVCVFLCDAVTPPHKHVGTIASHGTDRVEG